MISQPVGFKSPDLNIMCTNTSTYLVVKMKFISFIVLECGRINFYRGVSGQKLQVVKNIDVIGIMWSL